MTSIEIIKSILSGSTITVTETDFYINRYRSSWCIINNDHLKNIARYLIYMEIITIESGNFQTREEHYLLNENFYHIKDNIKYIQFSKIEDAIIKFTNKNYKSIYLLEIEEIFTNIKIKEVRKQKINKINYGSNVLS